MTEFFAILMLIAAFIVIFGGALVAVQTPEERAASKSVLLHGEVNKALHCPHCNTTGKIRTKPVATKAGISGGKAAAGILTGGASILVTGLSRNQNMTRAHCDHCNMTWTIA